MIASSALIHFFLQLPFSFPSGAVANEEIVLRLIHIVAGITWIGLLYFFNLVGTPLMMELEMPERAKLYPKLMPRAMNWARWSALVTVVVALRYFGIILGADAANAGQPGMAAHWFGEWFLVWTLAYALIYALQMPAKGALDNGWVRAVPMVGVVLAASWIILRLNASPESSNAHLAISVGGGLGWMMLLNMWGVMWRAQKRLIGYARAYVKDGTPIPPDAPRLIRWSFLASRTGFWLSFPMLFFMAAAEHYPFLGK
jgi:uncharacterized membrane protein